MGIRVVFLDFDGVLNHDVWFKKLSNHMDDPMTSRKPEHAFDPECAKRVDRLCNRCKAVIVVSSSWRYGRSVGELGRMLRAIGITAKVIDATPMEIERDEAAKDYPPEILEVIPKARITLSATRGREIAHWLEHTGFEVDGIVILDDDRDIAPLQHRHVETSFHRGGFLEEHIEQAAALLVKPWPPKIEMVHA